MSFADPELEKLRQILTKKAAREREYIHIPFEQRGKARQAGAMWDTERNPGLSVLTQPETGLKNLSE